MTNEWSDGIVAKTVREAVEDQSDKRKWVIFDGPVDALWIENMNTVLDDNKMLCLSNGQRIKLSNAFTMLFEVNDLAVASPATVSRCGMVFLDEYALGWEPLLDSWSKTFTERYIDKETETVPPHIPSLINKFK
jgi:dynein heavy chain